MPAAPTGTRPTVPAAPSQGAAAARPETATPAAKPTEGDVVERLDGIRGWLGDLDSTVGVRSRIGLVLAAIAIGAAGAAIYLSLDAKSQSASNSDVGNLRGDVDSLQDELSNISGQLDTLQSSVGAARSQASGANATASSLEAQIRRLKADVKELQQTASAAPTTVPTVPPITDTGTGTTTTPDSGGTGGNNSP